MMRSGNSRRHRLSRPLLLLTALIVIGSLQSILAPVAQVSADTGTSHQVKQGRMLLRSDAPQATGLRVKFGCPGGGRR